MMMSSASRSNQKMQMVFLSWSSAWMRGRLGGGVGTWDPLCVGGGVIVAVWLLPVRLSHAGSSPPLRPYNAVLIKYEMMT